MNEPLNFLASCPNGTTTSFIEIRGDETDTQKVAALLTAAWGRDDG
jgi:hypothetical protein